MNRSRLRGHVAAVIAGATALAIVPSLAGWLVKSVNGWSLGGMLHAAPAGKDQSRKTQAKSKADAPKATAGDGEKPEGDAAQATGASEGKQKATAKTEQPLTTWEDEAVTAELERCRKILASIDAVAIPLEGFRKNKCGAPAPIQLISVGKSPEVVFSPPARVTCQLAGGLHEWITGDLQKLAKKHLGDQIIRIEVMSDYSCRNAYGRKGGRLSEHAMVNALDIRGFVTASGKTARVLASWGETRRDVAAAIARAKKAHEAQKARRKLAEAGSGKSSDGRGNGAGPSRLGKPQNEAEPEVGAAKVAMVSGSRQAGVPLTGALANKKDTDGAGGKKPVARAFVAPPRKPVSKTGWFLRHAHASGCKIFGTILGPEANEAHRNHFHVDMAPRRRSNFCE